MPLKKKAKKVIKKRVIKKKPVKKIVKKIVKKAKEEIQGIVTHYFPKVRAAVIKLKAPLNVGDKVKIKGHTTDFTQTVASLQIDRVAINSAKKGQEIGLLVDSRVRQKDKVYKL
ncbi:MAG: translation elongation factor-like protein [Candidatus Omnitrophota bacterium]